MNRLQKILFRSKDSYHIFNERFYARWMRRNPANVILPFEGSSLKQEKVIDLKTNIVHESEDTSNLKKVTKDIVNKSSSKSLFAELEHSRLTPDKLEQIKKKRQIQQSKLKAKVKAQKVFDDNNELIYEKLKSNDGRIGYLFFLLMCVIVVITIL